MTLMILYVSYRAPQPADGHGGARPKIQKKDIKHLTGGTSTPGPVVGESSTRALMDESSIMLGDLSAIPEVPSLR